MRYEEKLIPSRCAVIKLIVKDRNENGVHPIMDLIVQYNGNFLFKSLSVQNINFY